MALAPLKEVLEDHQHITANHQSRVVGPACPLRPKLPLLGEPSSESDYPLDYIGTVLQEAILETHDVLRAPLPLVAHAFLGAATLAVQAHVDVEMDGRRYITSQFFLAVGESGERKSSVDRIALFPHRMFEAHLRRNEQEELREYKIKLAAYEAYKESKLRRSKGELSPEAIADLIRELGDCPVTPITNHLLVDDLTIEGLHKVLMYNRPSLGLFSDEGGKIFGGHNFKSINRMSGMAGLNSLWDGGQVKRFRAGSETISYSDWRFTISMLIQPNVASSLLNMPEASGQGFLARCLVVYPRSTAGSRFYEQKRVGPAVRRFHDRITEILNTQLPLNHVGNLVPRVLDVLRTSKEILIEFHDKVEAELGPGGLMAPVRPFASKALEHALRMAGVLTYFADPKSCSLDEKATLAAIRLTQFFLDEQTRLHVRHNQSPDIRDAAEMLEWLHRQRARQGKEVFTIREITQLGPNRLRSKQRITKTLNFLEERGHVVDVTLHEADSSSLRRWHIR